MAESKKEKPGFLWKVAVPFVRVSEVSVVGTSARVDDSGRLAISDAFGVVAIFERGRWLTVRRSGLGEVVTIGGGE